MAANLDGAKIKTCGTCRFLEHPEDRHVYCRRPQTIEYEKANEENDRSPNRERDFITGGWKRIAYVRGEELDPQQTRKDTSLCGPEGKWWEPSWEHRHYNGTDGATNLIAKTKAGRWWAFWL